MKKLLTVLSTVVIGIGIYLIYTRLFPTPEQQIQKHLTKVGRLIQIDYPENPIVSAKNSNSLSLLFAKNAQIKIDIGGLKPVLVTSQKEIAEKALVARRYLKQLEVQFEDLEIELAPSKTTADVQLVMEFRGQGAQSNTNFVEASEMNLKYVLDQDSKDWVIQEITNVSALKFR